MAWRRAMDVMAKRMQREFLLETMRLQIERATRPQTPLPPLRRDT
jgi:hypothetical protein